MSVTPDAPPPSDSADRLADNRTASRVCGTVGLGDTAASRAFVRRMQSVQQAWPSLSPDGRLARVQAVVNATAQQEGVPPIPVHKMDLPTGLEGGFDRPSWGLYLRESDFGKEGDSLSDKQASRFAETVYHETRHAEQAFLVARRRAAQGASARTIADAVGMPSSVADAARARPLPPAGGPGTPSHALNECARVLDVSLTGAGGAEATRVYKTLGQRTEAVQRAAEADSVADAKLRRGEITQSEYDAASAPLDEALDRGLRTQRLYENLPHEADSFAIGTRVRKMWR